MMLFRHPPPACCSLGFAVLGPRGSRLIDARAAGDQFRKA